MQVPTASNDVLGIIERNGFSRSASQSSSSSPSSSSSIMKQAIAYKSKDPNRTCCGVIQEAAETAREKRENRTKAQPWIVRKLMVGITAGLMGYTAYVYIRHLCLPMIWRRNGAPGSRDTGSQYRIKSLVINTKYSWYCSRLARCLLCIVLLDDCGIRSSESEQSIVYFNVIHIYD